MIALLHYASCPGWHTGDTADCTCGRPLPFLIRKDLDEEQPFPWRVWRWTRDFRYEPVMRCVSFEHARQLVAEMMSLCENPTAIWRSDADA